MKFSVISLGVFLFHFGFQPFQPTTINIIAPGVGQKVTLNNEKLTIQVQVISEEAIQSVIVLFDGNGDGIPEVKEATQVSNNNIYEAQFDSISGRPGKRLIYAHVTNQSLITASTSVSIDLIKGVYTNTRISTYFEDILGIGKIKSVAYSKDGQKVILGGGLENEFGYAFLFDIPSKRIVKKFFGHTDIITSVAFSPLTDSIIATGSYDGTIKLWSINSGDMIHNLQHMSFDGYYTPAKVNDFVFSPQGNQILSGTDQIRNSTNQFFSLVWLWDVSTGDTIRTIRGQRVEEKHKGNVLAVDFSPTGDTIITGSADKTVKLWRTSNGSHLNTFGRHTQPVNSVAFSPKGNQIATGSQDGKVLLTSFNNNTLQEKELKHTSSSYPVMAVAYSNDGRLVFTSGNLVEDIKVWSTENGELTQTLIAFDGPLSNSNIEALAISPMDNSLFSAADNSWMVIWDTQKDDKVSIPITVTQQNLPTSIKMSNFDKRFLTLNSSFNQFFIIQNKDNNEYGKIEYKNPNGTRQFQYQAQFFNTDSKLLTIVNDQNKIKLVIWDTKSYQILSGFDLNSQVSIFIADIKDLSISPDDSMAFLATIKGVFQIQLSNGSVVDKFLLKSNDVNKIAINPDGTIFATNHSDGKVRVWDIKRKIILDSLNLKTFFNNWMAVTNLYLSPVSNKLIVASLDGSILWDFEAQTLKFLKQAYNSTCAFSSNGNYLITCNNVIGVGLWDTSTGEIVRIIEKKSSSPFVKFGVFEPGTTRVLVYNQRVNNSQIQQEFIYRESLLGRRIFFGQFIEDDVSDVALTKDESKLFTGGVYDKALLWDLKSGNLINNFDVPFFSSFNALEIFPDGNRAITLDDARSAILWDTHKGLMTKRFLFDNPISPLSLALSPDQQYALIGANNSTAYIWDFNQNNLSRSYSNFPASVNSVLFNKNGSKIIAASDKIVRILEPNSGNFFPVTFDTHEKSVISLALSDDESFLATGSKDGKARIWDINTGGLPLVTIQHSQLLPSEINSVTFSKDGTKLLTSGYNSAKIWNTRTGELLTILEGHGTNLSFAKFLNNDTRVVTSTGDFYGDRTIRIWNSITSLPRNNRFGGHRWVRPPDYFSGATEPNPANGYILGLDVSPSNNNILTAGTDRKIFAWDLNTDSLSLVFGPQPHLGFVESVRYNRTGNRVLTHDGFRAHIWDAGSGIYLGRTFTDYSGDGTGLGSDRNISAAIFAPSDTLIITGHGVKPFGGTRFINCHAVVWSIATGKRVGASFEGHTMPITSLDISSDGRKLITGSSDQTARIWDFASRTTLLTLHHSEFVQAVAFSPDGSKVLTGVGGTVTGTHFAYLWDANTGALLHMFMHPNGIQDVHFHPQGKHIVVVSGQQAYVWNIEDGSLVFTVGHEERINVAKFFPDGSKLVTAGYDNRAKVWDFNK